MADSAGRFILCTECIQRLGTGSWDAGRQRTFARPRKTRRCSLAIYWAQPSQSAGFGAIVGGLSLPVTETPNVSSQALVF